VTFEELKEARFVEHHRCGACGAPVGYQVHHTYATAVFNSRCDCSPANRSIMRPLTHEELAMIPPVTPA